MLTVYWARQRSRGLTNTVSQSHRARSVEMHDKTGCQRRSMQQEAALAGMCWSLKRVSVIKKYVLALIGKVSAPTSRIQVLISVATLVRCFDTAIKVASAFRVNAMRHLVR